jgi:hypothetical protein
MSNLVQFGEKIEGYDVPVLNEREIRASAGILFLFMFISLMLVIFQHNFLLIKYMLSAFLVDLLIRVFVNPKFSPTLIIGRLIVANQVPEYVGAPQKKFAWIIGVALSATMFTLMVIMNSYSVITGLICYICLGFLFFESAFGICLGCKFYPLFYKEKASHCGGEVCSAKSKAEIVSVSRAQLVLVFIYVAVIVSAAWLFNERLSKQPHNLFEVTTSATT